MNKEEIVVPENRISVKFLSELNMSSYCSACFLRELTLKKYPGGFPAVFSSFDKFQKAYFRSNLEDFQRYFPGFQPVDNINMHWSKYKAKFGGITVRGGPDEIARNDKGECIIIDYKTSNFKGDKPGYYDDLYIAQLNNYGSIFRKLYPDPIVGLYLVYFDPQGKLKQAGEMAYIDEADDGKSLQRGISVEYCDGILLPFAVRLKEISIDSSLTLKLVNKLRNLIPTPIEGCKKCQYIRDSFNLMNK